MKRNLWRLLFVLLCAAHLGGAVVLWRAPDPRYKLSQLAALGRYDMFDNAITEAASEHSLDPLLLKAVAWRASRFDPTAMADGGRRGLLLIGEDLGREWAEAHKIESFMPADLYEPRTNLRTGAWALARAMKRWETRDDPVPFALAELHGGPAELARRAGAFSTAAGMMRAVAPDTRGFVNGVLHRARMYRIER